MMRGENSKPCGSSSPIYDSSYPIKATYLETEDGRGNLNDFRPSFAAAADLDGPARSARSTRS